MATKTPKKTAVEPKKITDVDKPGTQKPDDTARPIIVGHKGILLDPMVAGGNKTQATTAAKQKDETEPTTAKSPKAEPISIKILPDTDVESVEQPVVEKPKETPVEAAPAEEEPAPQDTNEGAAAVEPEPEEEEKKEQQPSEPANEETAEDIDEKNEEDLKKAEASKAESNAGNEEAIKRLVESKQYFLPIKKSRQGSGHGLSLPVVVLLLVVLLGGTYAALDAQIIKNSIPLPYHIFKNISRP